MTRILRIWFMMEIAVLLPAEFVFIKYFLLIINQQGKKLILSIYIQYPNIEGEGLQRRF